MKLLKTLSAMTAASALLLLSATPSAAATQSVTYEITDGTLVTTIGTFDLGGGGNPVPPCNATGADTITVLQDDAATPNWDTDVTDVDIESSVDAGSPLKPYIVKISEHTGSNDGQINALSGGSHAVTQDLSVKVQFYSVVDNTAPNCVQNALVCTLQVNFNSSATLASALTGTTLDTPFHSTSAPADTVENLAGTGRASSIFPLACNLPFSAVRDTNPTLSNLDLLVVAP